MPVNAPVGSFATTGLIHTLAWLALPAVIVLYAVASPAVRRHVTKHRKEIREHLYGPEASAEPTVESAPADQPQVPVDPDDDFDYTIYDTTPSSTS